MPLSRAVRGHRVMSAEHCHAKTKWDIVCVRARVCVFVCVCPLVSLSLQVLNSQSPKYNMVSFDSERCTQSTKLTSRNWSRSNADPVKEWLAPDISACCQKSVIHTGGARKEKGESQFSVPLIPFGGCWFYGLLGFYLFVLKGSVSCVPTWSGTCFELKRTLNSILLYPPSVCHHTCSCGVGDGAHSVNCAMSQPSISMTDTN